MTDFATTFASLMGTIEIDPLAEKEKISQATTCCFAVLELQGAQGKWTPHMYTPVPRSAHLDPQFYKGNNAFQRGVGYAGYTALRKKLWVRLATGPAAKTQCLPAADGSSTFRFVFALVPVDVKSLRAHHLQYLYTGPPFKIQHQEDASRLSKKELTKLQEQQKKSTYQVLSDGLKVHCWSIVSKKHGAMTAFRVGLEVTSSANKPTGAAAGTTQTFEPLLAYYGKEDETTDAYLIYADRCMFTKHSHNSLLRARQALQDAGERYVEAVQELKRKRHDLDESNRAWKKRRVEFNELESELIEMHV